MSCDKSDAAACQSKAPFAIIVTAASYYCLMQLYDSRDARLKLLVMSEKRLLLSTQYVNKVAVRVL